MSKNILITGGAGFVGSNLAVQLKLKDKSVNVICFDNLFRKGSELNVSRLEKLGIQFIKGDIRNIEDLSALPKIDSLIECSAEPAVLAGYDDPAYTLDTNLIGTLNCLEKARTDNSDFIFLSTSRVYPVPAVNDIPFEETDTRFAFKADVSGPGYSYQGITEDFTLNGVKSLYGATKCASEQIVTEYLDMFDMRGVINRFSVIAGPWQFGKADQGLVGFWMNQHYFKGPLKYIGFEGKGKQVRDAIHVDDVCELVMKQLSNLDCVHGKIYNVGGGLKNSFSLLELTKEVQSATGNIIDISAEAATRKADVRIFYTDNSFIEEDFGWSPSRSIDQILNDIQQWLKDNEIDLKGIFC